MTTKPKPSALTIIVPNEENASCYQQVGELGQEERRLLMAVTGEQPRLDYPTTVRRNAIGQDIEVYDIPEDERADVLDMLYPFADAPAMDAELFDIHERKNFIVKDFLVTREGHGNFLVSPYYLNSGGTVLDWLELPEDGSLDDWLGPIDQEPQEEEEEEAEDEED